MEIQHLTDLKLNQNEYCYLTNTDHYSADSFQIRVPKLMPLMIPASTKVFNKNIFVNDSACKPAVANSVTTLDHITVRRSPNCSLAHKADKNGIVYAGTRITCTCMHGNFKDLIITDSL